MSRRFFLIALVLVVASSVLGQSVNWSQGVVYEYDGSGNVRKIGTDVYAYDTAQRLVQGSVAGSIQTYTYDAFGNRTGCQQNGGNCQYGWQIDGTTNRVSGRLYDKRGNMLQLPEGNALAYDELGMLRTEDGASRRVSYIYTADDERIAVYDSDPALGTYSWRWTLRGLDKKPLREFTSDDSTNFGTGNFKWAEDYIWREGALLATRQADPGAPGGVSTYHYHVDHLGTPRQVTNAAGVIIGRHDYLPFGAELPGNLTEPQLENAKFTGHERDFARDRPPLDYMHARYYEGRLGRFLSVDPTWESADLGKPQSWNRYSYVLNNPVRYTDPDGRCSVAVIDCVIEGGSVGGVPGALIGLGIGLGIVGGSQIRIGHQTVGGWVGEMFTPSGTGSSGEMAAETFAQNMANHMAEQQEQTSGQTGTIYQVPGEATSSGRPYVGRHNQPEPNKTRKSKDGRDRTKAEVIDTYDGKNTQEGRVKEQKAIDDRGGVKNLDNKRNEIAPKKKKPEESQ